MELLELVSSHVTVPVIGVVLCALMVFTFGFRSSAQPPIFTFEEHPEKKNKKRSKQTKIKSSANGNIKTTDSPGNTPSKSKSESPKAGLALPSKPKSDVRKETSQDLKGEKKLKVKKAGKGGVQTQNVQANDAPFKKETEEAGEWTTIQMSKKSKKPKPSKKESTEQVEPVVEAQHQSDTTLEVEADISPVIVSALTAHSPAIVAVSEAVKAESPAIVAFPAAVTAESSTVVAEVPTSPEFNRNRNKKRKEKVAEKKQAEEGKDAQTDAVDIKPVTVESSRPQSEEHGISKKKNKKDKKSVGEVPASLSETVPSSEHLTADQTLTQSEADQTLTQGEANQALTQREADESLTQREADESLTQRETGDSLTQREADESLTQIDAPELPSIQQIKPVQKKKKNAGKEIVQKEAHQMAADMQIRQLEKSVEAVNNSLTSAPSKAAKPEDVDNSSSQQQQQASSVTASQPPVGISFDEIGDAWVDAAPKSKKKKPRREN